MDIRSTKVERSTISCKPDEMQAVLDYCSQGGHEIVDIHATQDGRSRRYVGEVIVIAERPV